MASVVPVSERFIPYLLEVQMTDQEEDGTSMAVVLVLVVKPSGILLAAPVDFFPEDMLAAGHLAGPDDMIGPSVHVVCPAGRLQQMDGSPPVGDMEDKTLEVVLVDALPEIAENMSLVADYSGSVDALHLFDQDPFNYPMKDEVLALASDWIVQPTSGDRVNYYSAQQNEKKKELVRVLPVGNGIQPGKGCAGRGIGIGNPKTASAPKVKRPTACNFAGGPYCSHSCFDRSDCRVEPEDHCNGGPDEKPKQIVSIESATWVLSYSWICSQVGDLSYRVAQGDASTYQNNGLQVGAYDSNGFTTGGGDIRADDGERCFQGLQRDGQSDVCAVNGHNCTGCTNCKYERRRHVGPVIWNYGDDKQRSLREDEAAAGPIFSQGSLFRCGHDEHVSENESSQQLKPYPYADERPGCHYDTLCGEIWGFWKGERLWPNHVASGNDHGLHAAGELARGEGCCSAIDSVPGAISPRRLHGCGAPAITCRRPPVGGLHEQVFGSSLEGKSICTTCRSTMDHRGFVIHPRARCDISKALGCGGRVKVKCSRRKCNSKDKSQRTAQVNLEEEKEKPGGAGGSVILAVAQLGPGSGGGACPSDRCCPKPSRGSTESRKSYGMFRAQNHKKKTKIAGSSPNRCSRTDPYSSAPLDDVSINLSFQRFAASMPRWIMATKTPFAAFLAKTFHLQCGGTTPSSVVFPLPLADFGIFWSGGPRLSKRRLMTLLRKRLLHIIIVALNFIHSGFKEGDLELLGRRPNHVQAGVHRRLWSLVATCDTPGDFKVSPGRSSDEFIARLRSLEDFAKTSPAFALDCYGEGPEDFEVVASRLPKKADDGRDPDNPHGLGPYRPLDVSRLKLTGRGGWNIADHLHDELWLPYVEPSILRHGLDVSDAPGPNFSLHSKEENFKLAKLWSAQGLLCLKVGGPFQGLHSRVFNNFKTTKADRQIGDRRLMNAAEMSIRGPSQYLPGGYMMTSLHCPPGMLLKGICTDRKDFYHQAMSTRERSETNCLPFSYPASRFEGELALEDLKEAATRFDGRREVIGDGYGRPKKKALLISESTEVFPCFASLFQGDHLGVEFALSGHASMLEDVGLLSPQSRVLGRHPFPPGPLWEGLVIDDYFAITAQAVSDEMPPRVERCFNTAIQAYETRRCSRQS